MPRKSNYLSPVAKQKLETKSKTKNRYVKLSFTGFENPIPELEIYEDDEPVDFIELAEFIRQHRKGKKLTTYDVRFLLKTCRPLITYEELISVLKHWEGWDDAVAEIKRKYGRVTPSLIVKYILRKNFGIYPVDVKKDGRVFIGKNVLGQKLIFSTVQDFEDRKDVEKFLSEGARLGFKPKELATVILTGYLNYLEQKRLPVDSIAMKDDSVGLSKYPRALKLFARLLGYDAELVKRRQGSKVIQMYVVFDKDGNPAFNIPKEMFERAPLSRWLKKVKKMLREKNPFNL